MFNDTIDLMISDGSGKKAKVNLIKKGIAWETDKKYKFRNPAQFSKMNDPIWDSFVKPKGILISM